MFQYKPRIAMQVLLRLLDYAIRNDTHKEVLDVLGWGIKAASARVDRAVQSGPDEYADAVIDTETEIIERPLGAAYVVCQTQITAIVQAALRCREQSLRNGLAFTAFGERDHEVRRLGPRFDAEWSKIEVLWALASYSSTGTSGPPKYGPIRSALNGIPCLPFWQPALSRAQTATCAPEPRRSPTRISLDIVVFQTIVREWADQVRQAAGP
jgi:hypothetical protein